MFVEVIVDLKNSQIKPYYDYIVPEKFKNIIDIGMRVEVPFLNMHKMGVVYQIKETSELATKEIIDVLDPYPVIDKEIFYLFNEIKKKTFNSDPRIFYEVVPKEFIYKNKRIVYANDFSKIPLELKNKFNTKNEWTLTKSDQIYYHLLKKLENNNIIKINNKLYTTYSTKEKGFYYYNRVHTYKRAFLDDLIHQIEERLYFSKKDLIDMGFTYGKINTWIKHDVLIPYVLSDYKANLEVDLLLEETKLLKEITNAKTFSKYLVKETIKNDSIKFIKKLVDETINNNKKILITVPNFYEGEKLFNTLNKYFPKMAFYHSKLPLLAKNKAFKNVINNDAKIIIGTRSVSFLPIKDLSVILMLGCHDDSYIKTEGVHYDTKLVLLKKAQYNNIPIVYISNTPPINLMYEAKNNLLNYYNFYNSKAFNNICLIDMKEELALGNTTIISKKLELAINETLNENKKVVLFYNKKGYASYLLCRSCGYIPKCPYCDVPLRYINKSLICPDCNYIEEYNNTCPKCKQRTLKEVGIGIEYIYNFLKTKYKVLVIDKNSKTKDKDIIKQINDNKFQIVLGTQYLKNFSFTNSGLLAFVLVDSLLNYPVFNIKEQAYYEINDLINHFKTKTLMQTYNLESDVIEYLKTGYNNFYENIIKEKKLLKLPPFYETSYISFQGESLLKTYQEAFMAKKLLLENNYLVIGPLEDNIKKVKNLYRFNIVIKKTNIKTALVFSILNQVKNLTTITYSEVNL